MNFDISWSQMARGHLVWRYGRHFVVWNQPSVHFMFQGCLLRSLVARRRMAKRLYLKELLCKTVMHGCDDSISIKPLSLLVNSHEILVFLWRSHRDQSGFLTKTLRVEL